MTYAAKILADSMSPDGVRLTTFEVTMPRIVLAEFNTHRMFSRNSASSRAIPIEKMLKIVQEHPYIPTHWGKNQKGMQANEEVGNTEAAMAESEWLKARDLAVQQASALLNRCGIHKQITNRLLEPFMWHTVICTATEYSNFFHLRCHPDAHPDIRKPAELMREAYEKETPKNLNYGEWHLPLWGFDQDLKEDLSQDDICKVSIARCARVSYLTHDGQRDLKADIQLFDRLTGGGHMSPLEHVARPMTASEIQRGQKFDEGGRWETQISFSGNFRGWVQYRKTVPGEEDKLAPS